MIYSYITVDSLLNTITKPDLFFHGTHTLDPYQGCEFYCLYCDSCLEERIYVKTNAVEQLSKELPSMKNPLIIIGSVHDPYQPIEEKTQLTRKLLKYLNQYNISYHILTKSILIQRDLDLLQQSKAMVTISFCTIQEHWRQIIEPNAPSIKQRIELIDQLKQLNIPVNFALIPAIPGLLEEEIPKLHRLLEEKQITSIITKPLELKGRQKARFFEKVLKPHAPHMIAKYHQWYETSPLPPDEIFQTIRKTLIQNKQS